MSIDSEIEMMVERVNKINLVERNIWQELERPIEEIDLNLIISYVEMRAALGHEGEVMNVLEQHEKKVIKVLEYIDKKFNEKKVELYMRTLYCKEVNEPIEEFECYERIKKLESKFIVDSGILEYRPLLPFSLN